MSNNNLIVATPVLHLPVDVIIDILLRLPIKTLLTCTSVCKSWYNLVRSPDLISKHFKSTSNVLLVTEENRDFDDYIISLVYEHSLDSKIFLDLSLVGIRDEGVRWVVGVYYGLVCISLSYRECQLILFNPLTRQCSRIPHWKWWDKFKEIELVTVGFGFDPSTDDYKLVRTVRYERLNGEIIDHAEIYSQNSDNWTEIWMPFSVSLFYLVAIPGVFYWETRDLAYPDTTIVSFHMSDEIFRIIEGPQFLHQNWDKTYHKFVELKEELALVVTNDKRYFTVWMLNEDGNSWSENFKVGPVIGRLTEVRDVGRITVVGCSRDGDLVFEDDKGLDMETELLFYDSKSRATKSLPFDRFFCYCRVYGFKESLVPVEKVEF